MNYIVDDSSKISDFQKARLSGPIVIWYYADWCGHCTRMKDEWETYSSDCKTKGINVAKVKDEIIQYLNYEANISGYPTIEFHNKGKKESNYPGDFERTSEKLMEFTSSELEKLKRMYNSGYESDSEMSNSIDKKVKQKQYRKRKSLKGTRKASNKRRASNSKKRRASNSKKRRASNGKKRKSNKRRKTI